MFDDHPTTAFNQERISPQLGPNPALQVAWGDPVAMAVVADGGVQVDSAWLLMKQQGLKFRLASAPWGGIVSSSN